MRNNVLILFYFLFVSILFVSTGVKSESPILPENTIRIALSLDSSDAEELEKKLNTSLTQSGSLKRAKVICLSKGSNGYDQKHILLRNNRIDMMEGGFLIFYEFSKRKKNAKVMLHACYFASHDEKMFYIRGNIICNKNDSVKLADINSRAIYAVSESSSSGYMLQKAFLAEKGISLDTDNINFLGDQRLIYQAVSRHPQSVGFVGNFIPLDKNKFTLLECSPKTPGGVLFADLDAFDSEKTYRIIKKQIELFYLNLYNKHKTNHFFVAPLSTNYKKYFPNYKGAEDLKNQKLQQENDSLKEKLSEKQSWIYIVVGIAGFVVIALIVYIAYRIWSDKKQTKKLLQEVGIRHLIEQIDDIPHPPAILKPHKSKLHKSIDLYEKERFDLLISDLTKNTEELLVNIISQINTMIKNENKHLIPKKNDFRNQIDAFIPFAVKIQNNKIKEYQLSETDLNKIKKIIYLVASLKLLYFYRNPSHHHSELWQPDKHKATQTLHCYAYIIYKLLDSQLFNK
jgi:hypothetical protein